MFTVFRSQNGCTLKRRPGRILVSPILVFPAISVMCAAPIIYLVYIYGSGQRQRGGVANLVGEKPIFPSPSLWLGTTLVPWNSANVHHYLQKSEAITPFEYFPLSVLIRCVVFFLTLLLSLFHFHFLPATLLPDRKIRYCLIGLETASVGDPWSQSVSPVLFPSSISTEFRNARNNRNFFIG